MLRFVWEMCFLCIKRWTSKWHQFFLGKFLNHSRIWIYSVFYLQLIVYRYMARIDKVTFKIIFIHLSTASFGSIVCLFAILMVMKMNYIFLKLVIITLLEFRFFIFQLIFFLVVGILIGLLIQILANCLLGTCVELSVSLRFKYVYNNVCIVNRVFCRKVFISSNHILFGFRFLWIFRKQHDQIYDTALQLKNGICCQLKNNAFIDFILNDSRPNYVHSWWL